MNIRSQFVHDNASRSDKAKFPLGQFLLSMLLFGSVVTALVQCWLWLRTQSFIQAAAEQAGFWGNVATIATVGLAFAGFLFGFRQYAFDARARRATHMHSLFGDFLRMRFDFILAAAQAKGGRFPTEKFTADESMDITDVMLSFRLYTLEEMLEWIRRERKHIFWTSHLTKEGRRRLGYLEGWVETVTSHLEPVKDRFEAYFRLSAPCYGTPFLVHVQNKFADECGDSILSVLRIRGIDLAGIAQPDQTRTSGVGAVTASASSSPALSTSGT